MKLIKRAALAAILAAPTMPAQDLVVRVRAPQDAQVFLLFSTGRAPGMTLPGLDGVLRLELSSLVILPAQPPRDGVSTTVFAGLAALPGDALKLQPLILTPRQAQVGAMSLPIADQAIDAAERALPPLGPLGRGGPFLFGLARDQILATARRYASAIDEARLLETMRRPYGRHTNQDLAGDVGMDGAVRLMHEHWSLQLQGVPAGQIAAIIESRTTTMTRDFFLARFPDGVGDDDEFWGLLSSGAPASTSSSKEVTVTSGNRRVRLSVALYDYGDHALGSVVVNSYKKTVFWFLNAADRISHSSTITSDYGSVSFSEVDYDENEVRDSYNRWGSHSGVYSLSSTGTAQWYGVVTLSASASVST